MQMLFVEDVAKLRSLSVSGARKWLVALEREHGPRIVRRNGNRLWTTERALARIEPGSGPSEASAYERRLRAVERRAERAERSAMAYEAQARELDARLEVLEAERRRARGYPEKVVKSTGTNSSPVSAS
jgi:hypothetical protein